MSLSEFDELRFQYEYGGATVKELCSTHGYIMDDLAQYIKEKGWEKQADPDEADPEAIAEFYTTARRAISVRATRRAVSVWDRLCNIEDALIEKVSLAIKEMDHNDELPDALEISRLGKVIETIQTGNRMFADALGIPAAADADQSEPENPEDKHFVVEVVHTTGEPKESEDG